MTKREAAIVSAYTRFLIGEFSEMQEYAEKLMGHPVFTHMLGDETFCDKLREKSKKDFVSIDVT